MSEEKSHFRIRKGDIEIEYSGKPSDVNRQFKVASEWVKGIIVVTPPPNVSEEKNKDRELQIELAKVQVEAQFYTTAAFSVFAVPIAIVVWLEQLLLLAPPSTDWKNVLTLVILALIVIAFVAPMILLGEINKVRERIEELRVKISNPSTEESTRKS